MNQAPLFADRKEAGCSLVPLLQHYQNSSEAIVLALPRGGVPVAAEVANQLGLDLDIIIVRKLGIPWNPEAAMGAIASGDVTVINEWVDPELPQAKEALSQAMTKEKPELERREDLYRSGRPPLSIEGRDVILIDDGLATGATMRAAVQSVIKRNAKRCIVAVPVASIDACDRLREVADEVICTYVPEPFHGVGQFYQNFTQTSDNEVQSILAPHFGKTAHSSVQSG